MWFEGREGVEKKKPAITKLSNVNDTRISTLRLTLTLRKISISRCKDMSRESRPVLNIK